MPESGETLKRITHDDAHDDDADDDEKENMLYSIIPKINVHPNGTLW